MSEDGLDYPVGYVYPMQDANEDKNHNHQNSALPANIQPGMLYSNPTTNELHHCVVAGAQGLEVWQGLVLCVDNEILIADNEVLFVGYI